MTADYAALARLAASCCLPCADAVARLAVALARLASGSCVRCEAPKLLAAASDLATARVWRHMEPHLVALSDACWTTIERLPDCGAPGCGHVPEPDIEPTPEQRARF